MSSLQTTRQSKYTSARHRLNVLESVASDIVQFDLGATTIPILPGSDTSWFRTTSSRCAMSGPTENYSDQDFATLQTSGVTQNTMKLVKGRYLVTLDVRVQNSHASLAMDYRFALSDDAATALAFYNSNTVNIILPAASTNFQTSFSKKIMLDLPDEENIIYYCHALDSGSQAAALVRGVASQITVQRLG